MSSRGGLVLRARCSTGRKLGEELGTPMYGNVTALEGLHVTVASDDALFGPPRGVAGLVDYFPEEVVN
jgi:hypothetical protein